MYDHEHCSSVTATMKHLEWPTLEHRREIQRLTMMFKVVWGLVAVPSTQLTPADQRTRANHQFKYRNILTNPASTSSPFFLVPSSHGTSCQLRWSTLQHLTCSRVAYPKLPCPPVHRHDIPMGVCRLHPRSRRNLCTWLCLLTPNFILIGQYNIEPSYSQNDFQNGGRPPCWTYCDVILLYRKTEFNALDIVLNFDLLQFHTFWYTSTIMFHQFSLKLPIFALIFMYFLKNMEKYF